jgi:hypothetical protein
MFIEPEDTPETVSAERNQFLVSLCRKKHLKLSSVYRHFAPNGALASASH